MDASRRVKFALDAGLRDRCLAHTMAAGNIGGSPARSGGWREYSAFHRVGGRLVGADSHEGDSHAVSDQPPFSGGNRGDGIRAEL